MLTPARPQKGDPLYQEKMKQYRRDLEDKTHNPRNWGMVHAAPSGASTKEAPARGGKASE